MLGLVMAVGLAASNGVVECPRPNDAIARAVCGDRDLRALDRETARLHGVVAASLRGRATARFQTTYQAVLAERVGCVTSPEPRFRDPVNRRGCLMTAYISTITWMRRDYPAAQRDTRGISRGVDRWRCQPNSETADLTFLRLSDNVAWLVVDNSDAEAELLYEGVGRNRWRGQGDLGTELEIRGARMTLTMPGPGGRTMTCRPRGR